MKTIYDQAREELAEELFREAVEEEKKRLRERRTIWERIFPYKIKLIKIKGKKNGTD